MAILSTYPEAIDSFAQGDHIGLDFVYKAGRVRFNNVVTRVIAGVITLIDNTINYIEVNPKDGTISTNTIGYSSGHIPLYIVETDTGEITAVQDDRCFFSVAAGGGLTDKKFLSAEVEVSDIVYEDLAQGTGMEILMSSDVQSGEDGGGARFTVDGNLIIDYEVM